MAGWGRWTMAVGLVLLLLAAAPHSTSPSADPGDMASLTGGGWEKGGCVVCIAGIVFAGRGTPLGMLVNAWLAPEPYVACGALCYTALM